MPKYSDPTLTVHSANQPLKSSAISPTRISIGQILVLVAGLLALGIAGYMYWQTTSLKGQSATVQTNVASVQRQVNSLQPVVQELTEYDQVGTGLKTLFSGQILWTNTLANIESKLYRNMALTNLQVDSKGTVALSGTTPSYTDYAKIYSSLTDPGVAAYFSQVKPVSTSKLPSGVITFSFSFVLAPSQFVYASTK